MTDLRAQIQSGLGDAYTLERELGGGGMSRVFVARDEKLGREVVVKVIAPELAEGLSAERFTREVRLAARLQQANIVPVLTAGTIGSLPYFTMPFVRGESLRARLATGTPVSLSDAISVLRDVGRALAYAHAEGVVHRDIKPENILLSGGAAVVTDFGIAKALDASRTHEGGGIVGITQVGASLGTPAYMAPEQALGDPHTDQRADIYAWGVVAWELLGDRHPFAGRTTMQALIAAHLTEAPPSLRQRKPDVPVALEALVMRCLEKDPDNRPSTASELLAALDTIHTSGERSAPMVAPPPSRTRAMRLSGIALLVLTAGVLFVQSRRGVAPATSAGKSIAVIPFTVTGGDTANSYLAEGLADQLTNSLALIPGLRLAGRTSAARFGGKGATAQEVGTALGVATVLDGTVRRVGNQIRVSVELSNTKDGLVIWHENYERDAADLFTVQDDIASAIAAALQVTLVGAGAASVRGTDDPVAYDLYLKGLYLFRRRGPGLATGSSSFEQAIARDSNFARAWAGLASTLMVMPYFLDIRMGEVIPRARAAAERAIRLDSTLAEGHLSLGFVLAEAFDYEGAEREIRRAIALDTTSAEPLYRYGWLLLNTGRSAEAIPVLQQAKARDPLYFLISAYLGWAQINQGQVDEGIAEERRAADLEPRNLATLSIITRGYYRSGMPDSSRAAARRLAALTRSPIRLGAAAFSLARTGAATEADAIVRQMEALPPTTWTKWSGLAIAYTGKRDFERAIGAMQQAAKGDGDLFVPFASVLAGELPQDPRIDAVWRRFHLDPARFATSRGGQRP